MIRLRKLRTRRDPSRALSSDIVVPCPPGLAYDPYQLAGIEYSYKRLRCLNGDDPGSGKTIQAIGLCNYIPTCRRILIVCPGFLKPHWRNEFLKWDVKGLTVGVAEGMKGEFPTTNVVVINYDILKAYRDQLRAGEWDLMIVDEVHKLKSRKADRTREVWGGIKRNDKKQIVERVTPIPCKRQLALTGTPSLNGKPKELWNMLQALDPNGLGADWYTYANRYCKLLELKRFDPTQGKEVRIGWLWDESDNLDELQRLMRERFMVRRLKADIMSQLPPKRRMIIPIPIDKSLKKVLGKDGLDFESARNVDLDKLEQADFGEYSKAMLNIGLSLVEPTVEVVQHDLDEYSKIVVMCYHREVAREIEERLNGRKEKKSSKQSNDQPLDSCSKTPSTRKSEMGLSLSMRNNESDDTREYSQREVKRMHEMSPDSRDESDSGIPTLVCDKKSLQGNRSSVQDSLVGYTCSSELSFAGDSSEIQQQKISPEQPIRGQNSSSSRVHEEQHMGCEPESQSDKGKRNSSGTPTDSPKFGDEVIAVRIDGDVPPTKRQALVDAFRNDPACRILVGTIGAVGVGFTLVEAHLMVFPERSWVPGDVTQAEDRIHRRGQFEQAIYKHLVLEGGQSQRQVKVLINKQDTIDFMLDKKPNS